MIIPTIRYTDAPAAIDFLERAFGFERKAVYGDGDVIHHAELTCGRGMVMLGSTGLAGWGACAVMGGLGAICLLLGSSKPFTDARLAQLYSSRQEYEQKFAADADKAIKEGFVLAADRAALLKFAEPDRIPS